MPPGVLMVLSGPSGVGKGTIVAEYGRKYGDMVPSISSTTREKRVGEEEGVHYYFITPEEFERRIARDAFIEYAQVHGHYYGTSKEAVREQLFAGKNVLLEIDPQGAVQVKEKMKKRGEEAVLVFIYPPSRQELEKRLRLRATETPDQIELRLKNAFAELNRIHSYDYAIENKDVQLAVEQLHTVLVAEQLRAFRVERSWSGYDT